MMLDTKHSKTAFENRNYDHNYDFATMTERHSKI